MFTLLVARRLIIAFLCYCLSGRPSWDSSTTAEELEQRERAGFLEWRRGLAQVEERDHRLVLTPFEKNLLFWRQLWRVIEKRWEGSEPRVVPK